MTPTRTAYVVTEGEYSDYHLCGVFDDEALAKSFAETFGARVETWELNPHERQIREGLRPWFVNMRRDGTVRLVGRSGASYGFEQSPGKWEVCQPLNETPSFLILHCWAEDERHAVKIANEKRAQLIAEGQWPAAAEPVPV